MGCDQDSSIPTAAATAPSGNGIVSGRVVFIGMPPVRRVLVEPGKAFPGSGQIVDETIVVGPDGGLKNAIVYLKDGPAAQTPQSAPIELDQINCTFVPHVLALQAGQVLRLKSSDAMMHNVHLQCAVNPDRNYSFSAAGQLDVTNLTRPELPFRVKCDVHPWMTAWVAVMPHPWFAVTGQDGRFTISRVPPGTWTLAVWQEALPSQEKKITVSDDKPAEANFEFKD